VVNLPEVPEIPLGDELQVELLVDDQVMSDVALYAIKEGVAVAETLVLIAGEAGSFLLPPQAVRQESEKNIAKNILGNPLLAIFVLCDMVVSSIK
jgi:hypothetical protein